MRDYRIRTIPGELQKFVGKEAASIMDAALDCHTSDISFRIMCETYFVTVKMRDKHITYMNIIMGSQNKSRITTTMFVETADKLPIDFGPGRVRGTNYVYSYSF